MPQNSGGGSGATSMLFNYLTSMKGKPAVTGTPTATPMPTALAPGGTASLDNPGPFTLDANPPPAGFQPIVTPTPAPVDAGRNWETPKKSGGL